MRKSLTSSSLGLNVSKFCSRSLFYLLFLEETTTPSTTPSTTPATKPPQRPTKAPTKAPAKAPQSGSEPANSGNYAGLSYFLAALLFLVPMI